VRKRNILAYSDGDWAVLLWRSDVIGKYYCYLNIGTVVRGGVWHNPHGSYCYTHNALKYKVPKYRYEKTKNRRV
jgi:hypothetical protein